MRESKLKTKSNKSRTLSLNLNSYSQTLSLTKTQSMYESKLARHNLMKYNTSITQYNKILINNLLISKDSHLVAIFKDYMIADYIDEFLRRHYSRDESLERIPKFANYYKNYLTFFCKPIFRNFIFNTIVQSFGEAKAEIYYNKNYGNKNKKKKKSNPACDKLKTIFSISVKKDIDDNSIITHCSKEDYCDDNFGDFTMALDGNNSKIILKGGCKNVSNNTSLASFINAINSNYNYNSYCNNKNIIKIDSIYNNNKKIKKESDKKKENENKLVSNAQIDLQKENENKKFKSRNLEIETEIKIYNKTTENNNNNNNNLNSNMNTINSNTNINLNSNNSSGQGIKLNNKMLLTLNKISLTNFKGYEKKLNTNNNNNNYQSNNTCSKHEPLNHNKLQNSNHKINGNNLISRNKGGEINNFFQNTLNANVKANINFTKNHNIELLSSLTSRYNNSIKEKYAYKCLNTVSSNNDKLNNKLNTNSPLSHMHNPRRMSNAASTISNDIIINSNAIKGLHFKTISSNFQSSMNAYNKIIKGSFPLSNKKINKKKERIFSGNSNCNVISKNEHITTPERTSNAANKKNSNNNMLSIENKQNKNGLDLDNYMKMTLKLCRNKKNNLILNKKKDTDKDYINNNLKKNKNIIIGSNQNNSSELNNNNNINNNNIPICSNSGTSHMNNKNSINSPTINNINININNHICLNNEVSSNTGRLSKDHSKKLSLQNYIDKNSKPSRNKNSIITCTKTEVMSHKLNMESNINSQKKISRNKNNVPLNNNFISSFVEDGNKKKINFGLSGDNQSSRKISQNNKGLNIDNKGSIYNKLGMNCKNNPDVIEKLYIKTAYSNEGSNFFNKRKKKNK